MTSASCETYCVLIHKVLRDSDEETAAEKQSERISVPEQLVCMQSTNALALNNVFLPEQAYHIVFHVQNHCICE